MPNKLSKKRIGKLLVITDESIQDRFSHAELAGLAVAGGAGMIQYRDKTKETRESIAAAVKLKKICTQARLPLIINDRIDITMAVGADGVHLGLDDIPIQVARKLLGPGKIIGGTAGTLKDAQQAQSDGADYVGFGHIYPTSSKKKISPPVGLEVLKEVCTTLDIPVIAIGGINASNVGEVLRAGAHGVAVIRAVCARKNPEAAARELKEAIDRAKTSSD